MRKREKVNVHKGNFLWDLRTNVVNIEYLFLGLYGF